MVSPVFVSQILNMFLLLGTIFTIGLGVFVWWQNKKSLLNRIFALFSVTIAIWLFGTYMMLNNCTVERLVIFWDRFLYLGVIFIPIFLYHLSLALTEKIKEQRYKIFLLPGYIIAFLFLFLSRTDYFVKDVFRYKWGCHTIAQTGHHFFLFFFLFYSTLSFYLIYNCLKTTQNPILKIQSKYFLFALIILYFGSLEYLPAYQISVFPLGYTTPLIWLFILAYAITRYQLLNIKVILTDILVAAVIFTILIFTVLSENTTQFIGSGIFLILVSIFGWIAIRGVHREVEEKERLEQKIQERTKELKIAKDIAEKRAEEIEKRKEELEKFYKLTVGRELKMVELKQRIKELEEKIKGEKK